jgi:hypothetical protein
MVTASVFTVLSLLTAIDAVAVLPFFLPVVPLPVSLLLNANGT